MAMGLQSGDSAAATTVNTLINGYLDKDVAGSSDVTLTDAEAQNAVIDLTGTLAANINVIVPATETKVWLVKNATSGAYTLTVKTSAGSGIALTQGNVYVLVGDGTDVLDRSPS